MRRDLGIKCILLSLTALLAAGPALPQPAGYQLVDFIDLPSALRSDEDSTCTIWFREQWMVSASGFSILKKVEEFESSCVTKIMENMENREALCFKDISYEFSFLDPHQTAIRDLQNEIIALIKKRYPENKIYNMPAQLLSVIFHEEWILDPDHQEIIKKVRGITPVIWQKRQTEDAEAIPDPETGFPVYYTIKLGRINLREP